MKGYKMDSSFVDCHAANAARNDRETPKKKANIPNTQAAGFCDFSKETASSLKPEISRLLRKTKASFRSAGRLCCPSGEKERLLYAKHKAIGVR